MRCDSRLAATGLLTTRQADGPGSGPPRLARHGARRRAGAGESGGLRRRRTTPPAPTRLARHLLEVRAVLERRRAGVRREPTSARSSRTSCPVLARDLGPVDARPASGPARRRRDGRPADPSVRVPVRPGDRARRDLAVVGPGLVGGAARRRPLTGHAGRARGGRRGAAPAGCSRPSRPHRGRARRARRSARGRRDRRCRWCAWPTARSESPGGDVDPAAVPPAGAGADGAAGRSSTTRTGVFVARVDLLDRAARPGRRVRRGDEVRRGWHGPGGARGGEAARGRHPAARLPRPAARVGRPARPRPRCYRLVRDRPEELTRV